MEIKVQSKIHTGVYRYKVVSNQKQETKDTPSTASTTSMPTSWKSEKTAN